MISRALVLTVALTSVIWAQGTPAPEPRGAVVMRSSCSGCHGPDLVSEQRLTRAAWDREIAKMERWSAPLSAADREELLSYLATRFGPTASASGDASQQTAGESIYRTACRSCHEDDLTAQQRLSPAAWGRTVDKMVRWGAAVNPEQKEALVAYLSARYGPTR